MLNLIKEKIPFSFENYKLNNYFDLLGLILGICGIIILILIFIQFTNEHKKGNKQHLNLNGNEEKIETQIDYFGQWIIGFTLCVFCTTLANYFWENTDLAMLITFSCGIGLIFITDKLFKKIKKEKILAEN